MELSDRFDAWLQDLDVPASEGKLARLDRENRRIRRGRPAKKKPSALRAQALYAKGLAKPFAHNVAPLTGLRSATAPDLGLGRGRRPPGWLGLGDDEKRAIEQRLLGARLAAPRSLGDEEADEDGRRRSAARRGLHRRPLVGLGGAPVVVLKFADGGENGSVGMEARAAGDRVEAEAHPATFDGHRRRGSTTGHACAFYEPARRCALKALFDVEPHGDDARGKYGVALQAYVKPKGPSVPTAASWRGPKAAAAAALQGVNGLLPPSLCLRSLAADFVQDEDGRWWMLQIKAARPRRDGADLGDAWRAGKVPGAVAVVPERASPARAPADDHLLRDNQSLHRYEETDRPCAGQYCDLPVPKAHRHVYGDTLHQGARFSVPRKVVFDKPRADDATAPPPDASVTRLITMTRRERLSLYDTIHVCACCHFQYVGPPRALNVPRPADPAAIGAAVDGIVDAARDRDPAERPDDPPPPAFAPRNGTWLAGPGGGTVRATSPATLHRPASQTGRGGPRRSNRFEGGQWKSISSERPVAARRRPGRRVPRSGGHSVFDDASVGSLHSTLSKLSMPTFKVHPGDQHSHQNRCQTEFFSNLAYGRPPTVQPKAASNAGIRNADHYWRVVKDAPGHDNWKLYSPSKTNARGARYSTPQSNTVREVYGRKAKAPLLFARASSPSGGRPRSPFNFTATGYAKSPPGSRPRSPSSRAPRFDPELETGRRRAVERAAV
ncbi:hypothetical protein JL722_9924 [Aureococcus anophagefferens]|nr:hypothetical protein JL722_9924 [Aureococcus anophagefferens]